MGRQPRGRPSALAGRPSRAGRLPSRPTTRAPTWTTGTRERAPRCQTGTPSTPQVNTAPGAGTGHYGELRVGEPGQWEEGMAG